MAETLPALPVDLSDLAARVTPPPPTVLARGAVLRRHRKPALPLAGQSSARRGALPVSNRRLRAARGG